METIYSKLAEFVAHNETVAVATVIDVRGSTPREVGAKMIIHPLGQHVGTVGGGCGEADVIRAALDVIQTGRPTTVRVDLTDDISMQALGVCGGIMDVFVEQVARSGDRPQQAEEQIAALLASIQAREPMALVTVVSGPSAGRQAVVWLDRPPLGSLVALTDRGDLTGLAQGELSGLAQLESKIIADAQNVLRSRQHKLLRYSLPISNISVFVEIQRRAPELIIVGAGHIAIPLAQIASMCDFAVTVLDDRQSFANRERFPTVRKVITAPLRKTVRELPMDQDTFVVLVTRGHTHDVDCLLELLDRPLAYVGMIGSPRRVDAVFKLLEEEMQIDPARFDRVYAPIGIAIGAKTPAEIAVCIMAEIINVFRGGPAISISDRRREREQRRQGDADAGIVSMLCIGTMPASDGDKANARVSEHVLSGAERCSRSVVEGSANRSVERAGFWLG